VEGKNIVIEYRYAELKPDRLPALAVELVRLKVDVIVTGVRDNPCYPKTQQHDSIVMSHDTDPVPNGSVASLRVGR